MANPRLSKNGWIENFNNLNILAECTSYKILLIGDSLVSGLSRYDRVWQKYFHKRNTLNCGIGGDKCSNVLWRSKHMSLPILLNYIVIHCGTNDLNTSTPVDIANKIIDIGDTFKKRSPGAVVIVTGLLPRDLIFTLKRSSIQKVNSILNDKCVGRGFLFLLPDAGWLVGNNLLNEQFIL